MFAAAGTAASADPSATVPRYQGCAWRNPATHVAAQDLWDALRCQGADHLPHRPAAAEHALFSYTLRMPAGWRSKMVNGRKTRGDRAGGRVGFGTGAAGHYQNSDGFPDFAEASIRSQLQRLQSDSFALAFLNVGTLKTLGFAPVKN